MSALGIICGKAKKALIIPSNMTALWMENNVNINVCGGKISFYDEIFEKYSWVHVLLVVVIKTLLVKHCIVQQQIHIVDGSMISFRFYYCCDFSCGLHK